MIDDDNKSQSMRVYQKNIGYRNEHLPRPTFVVKEVDLLRSLGWSEKLENVAGNVLWFSKKSPV